MKTKQSPSYLKGRAELRYDLSSLKESEKLVILIRNKNMKRTIFEFLFQDISATGLQIIDKNDKHLSFDIGSIMVTTVDVYCKIFNRPIHAEYEIVNKKSEGDTLVYGLKLLHVENRHQNYYNEGIQKLINNKDSFDQKIKEIKNKTNIL